MRVLSNLTEAFDQPSLTTSAYYYLSMALQFLEILLSCATSQIYYTTQNKSRRYWHVNWILVYVFKFLLKFAPSEFTKNRALGAQNLLHAIYHQSHMQLRRIYILT
jgi:hypothetical protein